VLFVDPGDGGFQAMRRVPAQVAKLEPALVVLVRSEGPPGPGGMRGPRVPLRDTEPKIAILNIADPALHNAIAAAKTGPIEMKVSARVPAPKVETVKVRNVAAVIRGTDPTLKDTYLVVTGHYDHLGINPNLEGDKIFNGANDDASGSSSVVEIAAALQALPEKPKRTIVFVTVFGEEVGGLGARWYTGHPIFPLARTIADINLEQLGRTDDNEGPKPLQFNLTGFDYTDIAATFAKLTPQTDIRVVKHEKNSDAFFGRSDNATFADAGIPSTTISVSYVYPDYHKVSDEWPKLDYDNMAKVDRAIALGVWTMANDPQAPKWNKDNPKTARYTAQPR
jgi:Zn-dependent M28 family amino/carboxypeptidase